MAARVEYLFTELYGKKIAPLHFPIREDGKFVGYVNVVKQAGRKYIDKGKKEECPIPEAGCTAG